MINYSLSRHSNPMDADATKKYYAVPQVTEVYDLQKFAKHISSHGSVYSRADIACVLTMAVDCCRELLLSGYKVQLGDLGSFSIGLKSKGVINSADFIESKHIKRVRGNFTPGKLLKDLKADSEFNQVASRVIQKATVQKINGGSGSVTSGSGSSKKTTTITIATA